MLPVLLLAVAALSAILDTGLPAALVHPATV
jgi:hypothetical protein